MVPPPPAAPVTTAPPLDASVPAELRPFYQQQLDWGPCAEFATTTSDRVIYRAPGLECARLEVPIDYADPAAGSAHLGVLRVPATGERIGSLVFNPGGPGGSGMSFVAAGMSVALAGSPLARQFDLVGFDPRGVGSSTPTIDCQTDGERDAERADLDLDPSPAGVAQTEAENQQYVQQCIRGSGGEAFLANIGTRDVVRDLDVMRQVLGDEKLSYVGYSYGTAIGSAYAEAFPQNVRAMVLDGAVDPTQSEFDSTVEQSAGFQLAFDAFAADCATRPDCPLGQDPAQATAVFQVLSRPLIDAPLAVGDRVLSYNDAVTGVVSALYADFLWPDLTTSLAELRAGDGRGLLDLADRYHERAPDGSYANLIEAFTAISCLDDERITDRAQLAALAQRVNEVAPFADSGRGAVAALGVCAFWPVPPTSTPHVPDVQGLPTTLVVSTTGDPATPYQAGVDLAAALDARLISVEGNQHGASLQGNLCIDRVVVDYLVDLTAPAGQTNCTL
jgi:pimeloyl-ACP methyl ester carboxylesterase